MSGQATIQRASSSSGYSGSAASYTPVAERTHRPSFLDTPYAYNQAMLKLERIALAIFNDKAYQSLNQPLKFIQTQYIAPIETALDQLLTPHSHQEIARIKRPLTKVQINQDRMYRTLTMLSEKVQVFVNHFIRVRTYLTDVDDFSRDHPWQVNSSSLKRALASLQARGFVAKSMRLDEEVMRPLTALDLALFSDNVFHPNSPAFFHKLCNLDEELNEAISQLEILQKALPGILYTLDTAKDVSSDHMSLPASLIETLKQTLHFPLKKQRVINKGLFGSVWEVSLNHQLYALKFIKASKPNAMQYVMNEFYNIMRFTLNSHTNLITTCGFVSVNEKGFYAYGILMPRLLDTTFLEVILDSRHLLPKQVLLKILLGIASALKHLHDHRMLHGDLKPENIGFSSSLPEVPILFDLGLSHPSYEFARTGSVSFSAPEYLQQPEDIAQGPQPEIWSFGVLIFTSITGNVFIDASMNQTAREKTKTFVKNAQSKPSFMDIFLSKLFSASERQFNALAPSGEFQAIIRKCLKANPLERPTIDAIIADLEKMRL